MGFSSGKNAVAGKMWTAANKTRVAHRPQIWLLSSSSISYSQHLACWLWVLLFLFVFIKQAISQIWVNEACLVIQGLQNFARSQHLCNPWKWGSLAWQALLTGLFHHLKSHLSAHFRHLLKSRRDEEGRLCPVRVVHISSFRLKIERLNHLK